MAEPNPSFWKGKNILITGITGFVGSWLAETLTSEEYGANVYGLIRRVSVPNVTNILHIIDKITFIKGDLHDQGSIEAALKESSADIVFHLAAQSHVSQSFKAPIDTLYTNILGTANLLETCRKYEKIEAIHLAGSSEEYGLVIKDDEQYRALLKKYGTIFPPPRFDSRGSIISEIPINETMPFRPMSPYAVSKVACDMLFFQYHKSFGLPCKITRAFNHSGPRRGEDFVESTIAKQIAEGIRHGKNEIRLGTLDSVRDFSDVRDIIRGYMLVVEKGKPGNAYVLCSGIGRSIGEVKNIAINIAKEKFGLKHDMQYKPDPSKLRPSDVPILVGNHSKATKELGWEPSIPFEKTMEDMISYWLSKVPVQT